MRKFLYSFLLIAIFGCKSNQNSVGDPDQPCGFIGIVKDFAELAGCNLLIELDNGDRLYPVKINDADFELQAGQKIKFSYKELSDQVSNCMAESAFVEITCIELIPIAPPDRPEPLICVDTKNPFEIAWMNKVIDRHNPNQIVKYKYLNGWAYYFSSIPNSYLYDCQGTALCSTEGDPHDACHQRYLDQMGKGKIIWQGEGIWD